MRNGPRRNAPEPPEWGTRKDGTPWGDPSDFVPDFVHRKHPATRVTYLDELGVRRYKSDREGRDGFPAIAPLTCRICGRRVAARFWSRICDHCMPEYEKAQKAMYAARYRAKAELKRTYRILAASVPR